MAKACSMEDHEWVPSDNPRHVGGIVCQACGLDPEDAAIEESMAETDEEAEQDEYVSKNCW